MVFRPKRIEASDLQRFKYFEMITEFLTRLKDIGTERDESGSDAIHGKLVARPRKAEPLNLATRGGG